MLFRGAKQLKRKNSAYLFSSLSVEAFTLGLPHFLVGQNVMLRLTSALSTLAVSPEEVKPKDVNVIIFRRGVGEVIGAVYSI